MFVALAVLGSTTCGGVENAADDGGSTASGSSSGSSPGDAGPALGACGGYAWGPDWPGSAGQPTAPAALPPLYPAPDCGPGCRMVGTRLNFGVFEPQEFRFSGGRMVSTPFDHERADVNFVDLATGTDFEAAAEAPEPGFGSSSQAIMGADCFAKAYTHVDDSQRRTYVCEVCASTSATRLLAFADGLDDIGEGGLHTHESSGRYLVLEHREALEVIDTHDGSSHIVSESKGVFSEVSTREPYLVFPEANGHIWLVDVRDWSRTSLGDDRARQDMPSSDGKTVVWIDYSAGERTSDVVVYDIETQSLTRVTDAQKPAIRSNPTVEGDRVAWMESQSGYAAVIRGYNLGTKEEMLLVDHTAGEVEELSPKWPQLHGGKLYFVGTNVPSTTPNQLYELVLPPDP